MTKKKKKKKDLILFPVPVCQEKQDIEKSEMMGLRARALRPLHRESLVWFWPCPRYPLPQDNHCHPAATVLPPYFYQAASRGEVEAPITVAWGSSHRGIVLAE